MREVVVPLYRCAAYEQDLRFYLGRVGPNDDGDDGWRRLLPANTATQAYVVHLRHLAATQPLLLLAHAFTQHLAGLSGGVVLRRMARKHMALPQDQGTAIFEYPGGPEMKVCVVVLRAAACGTAPGLRFSAARLPVVLCCTRTSCLAPSLTQAWLAVPPRR